MIYENDNCVNACLECIGIAAYCAQACIEEDMKECAKHCLECVEICKAMAVMAARHSYNVTAAAEACIKICEACANECEKHDNDHCRACAEACRTCVEECHQIDKGPKRQAA